VHITEVEKKEWRESNIRPNPTKGMSPEQLKQYVEEYYDQLRIARARKESAIIKDMLREKERQETAEEELQVISEVEALVPEMRALWNLECSAETPEWLLNLKADNVCPPENHLASHLPGDILTQWLVICPIIRTVHSSRYEYNPTTGRYVNCDYSFLQVRISNNPQTQQRNFTQCLFNFALVCKSWQATIFGANHLWQVAAFFRFPYLTCTARRTTFRHWHSYLSSYIGVVTEGETPVYWVNQSSCCPMSWSLLEPLPYLGGRYKAACPTCGQVATLCHEAGEFSMEICNERSAGMLTRHAFENAMELHDRFKGDHSLLTWILKEEYDEAGPKTWGRRCF